MLLLVKFKAEASSCHVPYRYKYIPIGYICQWGQRHKMKTQKHLKLPTTLTDRITQSAKKNRRSFQDELIVWLENYEHLQLHPPPRSQQAIDFERLRDVIVHELKSQNAKAETGSGKKTR